MKEKLKIIYYKSLVYGYALMQIPDINENNKDELYIKQSQQIVRYFSRIKPKGLNAKDMAELYNKQNEVKVLDANYFKDLMFSPYVVSIMILDYLIREKNDLELKSRFGHFNTKLAIDEIEKYFKSNGVLRSHQNFVNKILEIVGD